MNVGAVFRTLRMKQGLKTRDVERLTGINRGTISRVELGRDTPRKHLPTLLDLYRTPRDVQIAIALALTGLLDAEHEALLHSLTDESCKKFRAI